MGVYDQAQLDMVKVIYNTAELYISNYKTNQDAKYLTGTVQPQIALLKPYNAIKGGPNNIGVYDQAQLDIAIAIYTIAETYIANYRTNQDPVYLRIR